MYFPSLFSFRRLRNYTTVFLLALFIKFHISRTTLTIAYVNKVSKRIIVYEYTPNKLFCIWKKTFERLSKIKSAIYRYFVANIMASYKSKIRSVHSNEQNKLTAPAAPIIQVEYLAIANLRYNNTLN